MKYTSAVATFIGFAAAYNEGTQALAEDIAQKMITDSEF